MSGDTQRTLVYSPRRLLRSVPNLSYSGVTPLPTQFPEKLRFLETTFSAVTYTGFLGAWMYA